MDATITASNTGATILLDAADLAVVSLHRWHVQERIPGYRYAATKVNGRRIYMHRLLAGPADGQVVDHINGDGLDNRRSNLRACTQAENLRNRRLNKNNTSGFKGVRFTRGAWEARIAADGLRRRLGRFATKEEAHAAYTAAAIQLHGIFANPGA